MSAVGASSVMGESALIDKETGRIYWEGGSMSTISASITPFLNQYGIRHVQATVLSIVLAVSLGSILSRSLRRRFLLRIIEDNRSMEGANNQETTTSSSSWPLVVLLAISRWMVEKVPEFEPWFVVVMAALYLAEAYACSTRRYLTHSISSPGGVEDYIERLREERPVVTWKVRCFHYEPRWFAPIFDPPTWKRALSRITNLVGLVKSDGNPRDKDNDSDSENRDGGENLPPGVLAPSLAMRKVVTKREEAHYDYRGCRDDTTAGLWKRAEDLSGSVPPFTKILLTKLLVLGSRKTREDYFQQQAAFVTREGQADEFAEFSTNVQVLGYQPRLLAVRNMDGIPPLARLFRLHLFWCFTLVGLTVPYRIWFDRHCDELRVAVVKETSSSSSVDHRPKRQQPKGVLTATSSRLRTYPLLQRFVGEKTSESFRKVMQELSLYGREKDQTADEETNHHNKSHDAE